MPHLVLTYSSISRDVVRNFQAKSARALADEMNFAPESIKCYAVKASETHIAGEHLGSFAHICLRMLDKPDRSEAVRRDWMDRICEIAADAFPDSCTLTAEAVFLPPVYQSRTVV